MALFFITKSSGLENRCRVCTTVATCVDTYFKSQGQTIDHVIVVDLGKPVQFSSFTFNTYVALSRGKGRDTIPLLRDFDNNLFTRHSSENLCKEELDWRNLRKRQRLSQRQIQYMHVIC
jgi:hypothetical protein